VQGTAKHYKKSEVLEETWREAKNCAVARNDRIQLKTYLSDTHALAFGRSGSILIVQTPNPVTTEVLNSRFRTTVMRTVTGLEIAFDGVPVHDVQSQSRHMAPSLVAQ